MSEIYGTTGIPGDSVTVRSGGSRAVSAAFETTLGLVGGMDTANGNASTGTVKQIESSADAGTEFGEVSELTRQIDLAFANGSGTVYAIAPSETETTESFSATATGTLSEAPIMDPQVHPNVDVTAQDSNGDAVEVTIEYGGVTTPSSGINLDPHSGDWEADSSDDYDITYTYGDYSSAIADVVKEVPRIVAVCSEATSHANTLLTELNSYDTNFDFMHGMVGATPEVSASSYSDSFDDRRLSVIAASRGYLDADESDMARTVGAVAGRQAGKPLGDSTTSETVQGLYSLHTDYTNSEASSFIDAQVLPVKQSGGISIIKDMTTSTDARFERIYISEIVDEATEISHSIADDFTGDRNTDENRTALEESHTTSYEEMKQDELLQNYLVSTQKGANDFEVDVDISLDVVGVMDTIDVTITVGDIVTNQGAI